MTRYCSVLCLSIVAAARVSAQQDAMPLMHEVVATIKSAKSYHFESITESDLSSELHHSWSESREMLAKEQPDRVRFETIENNGSYVVVSDGKTVWRASPDTREFIRTAVAERFLDTRGGGQLAEAGLQRLKFAMSHIERLEENLTKAEQLRNETLEVSGKPIECVVVRADYAPPKGSVGIESWTRTFWIDRSRRNCVPRSGAQKRGRRAV